MSVTCVLATMSIRQFDESLVFDPGTGARKAIGIQAAAMREDGPPGSFQYAAAVVSCESMVGWFGRRRRCSCGRSITAVVVGQ